MAVPSIDASKFITALRLVVQALPFSEDDREALLCAIEQRAGLAHKAKQRDRDQARPRRTPEQLRRHAAWMKAYRAAKRKQYA